jgi:hypothetical protein
MLSRVINQQATHYLRSNAKKVRAILPINAGLIYQMQVSLVH